MKINYTRCALLILLAFSFATVKAQVRQSQISVQPPITVNFKQVAAMEIIIPPKKTVRTIEQGEDIEENFKFKGFPITGGAIKFNARPNYGSRSSVTSPSPTSVFNGVEDNGTLIPPDVDIASGPTYVMETTNQQFDIFNKSGTLVSTVTMAGLFAASGGNNFFDPHVQYDAVYSRFVAVVAGWTSNGDMGIFVGISQTSDPTGSWYIYGFDAAGNTSDFMDYPLLGFNTNWVVVTGNDFIDGVSPEGRVFVMNRASLYSGTLGTVSAFADNLAFSICPAQTFDASQTTEYLVEDYNGDTSGTGYIRVSNITGTPSAPVYSTGVLLGINQPWSETKLNAPEEGESSFDDIEDGDTRFSNVVYISGSLWMSHTVFLPAAAPTHSAVDWWEVAPLSSSLQQYGRIEDPTGNTYYYYSSMAADINGKALLGYSESSPTAYASQAYSFHASTDASGVMESLVTYQSGVAGYFKDYGSGRNRWGDFSGTTLDPSDNTFWIANEWANTNNDWATAIAHIPNAISACAIPTGTTTTNTI